MVGHSQRPPSACSQTSCGSGCTPFASWPIGLLLAYPLSRVSKLMITPPTAFASHLF